MCLGRKELVNTLGISCHGLPCFIISSLFASCFPPNVLYRVEDRTLVLPLEEKIERIPENEGLVDCMPYLFRNGTYSRPGHSLLSRNPYSLRMWMQWQMNTKLFSDSFNSAIQVTSARKHSGIHLSYETHSSTI